MRDASPPEQEGERNAYELDHQDGTDEDAVPDAEFGAVGRGHARDGADAVVVDQVGDQEQEGLRIGAQIAQCLPEAPQGAAHRRKNGAVACRRGARRFGHTAKQRQREQQPPRRNAQERQAAARRAVRQAEGGGKLDPRQVGGQQDAAAQVPQGVSGAGDAGRFRPVARLCGSSES